MRLRNLLIAATIAVGAITVASASTEAVKPPKPPVTTTTTTTTQPPPTTTTVPSGASVWSNVDPGDNREPEIVPSSQPDSTGVCFTRNGVFNRCDATPNPYQMYPPMTLAVGDVLVATWAGGESTHIVGGTSTTTTTPPTTTTTTPGPTTTTTPPTTTQPPTGSQFTETFDGNSGLNRFIWGVYHRGVLHTVRGTPEPVDGVNNNIGAVGNWSADHDLACGDAHSQRPLSTEWQQDTTGANGFKPLVWPHVDELIYVCRDHVMSSMGDVAAFSVLWFAPNQVFTDVSSVSFDVNLTDLGDRQWWKVGVVTDSTYQSMCPTYGGSTLQVPCHVRSDVGSSDLAGEMEDADVLIATWSGGASNAGRFGMAIGETQVPCGFNAGSDKMTRFPVSLTDNGNGTVTFSVNGSSCTDTASFPACPCRVVFYDQNYNPNKDGMPIGHTWHWDNIVVR